MGEVGPTPAMVPLAASDAQDGAAPPEAPASGYAIPEEVSRLLERLHYSRLGAQEAASAAVAAHQEANSRFLAHVRMAALSAGIPRTVPPERIVVNWDDQFLSIAPDAPVDASTGAPGAVPVDATGALDVAAVLEALERR